MIDNLSQRLVNGRLLHPKFTGGSLVLGKEAVPTFASDPTTFVWMDTITGATVVHVAVQEMSRVIQSLAFVCRAISALSVVALEVFVYAVDYALK